jgi:nucleoside-diphosphate-sugar epimerase
MHILIIGGTHFIGPYVARQLIEQGHRVTVFHRGQTEAELSSAADHIYGDRRDLTAFANQFEPLAPDVVLDMIPYAEQEALDVMRTFKGVAQRVVAVSSMDVYLAYDRFRRVDVGPAESALLDEDSPLRTNLYPYRAYAKGSDDWVYNYEKILVERVVMSDPDLPGIVLRLSAVYGPGDYQHRVFDYVKRMDDGRPAILLEEGMARWRWSRGYVENVAAAIVLAVTSERAAGRIYNVGEEEIFTEAEWVRNVGQVAGWDGEIIAVSKDLLPPHLMQPYDWQHNLAGDASRIRRELGYKEHVCREEALKQTIAWERAHPPEQIDARRLDYAAEDAALARLIR